MRAYSAIRSTCWGRGARTSDDAARYFRSYADAIAAIGRAAGNEPLPNRPGISVKLSALHPRYEALSHERVMHELVPLVVDLARQAKSHDLNFTIDAEEADRLELSLDVIAAVAADPSLAGWEGFGLAIQAYQKRALEVIDWIHALAAKLDRRFMVRLVKGAYWDSEVKRAQERGLDDYPVWTRKAMTDLNYVACAERMLALRPRLYPQFATHNALTVAAILERAGGVDGFEFQRLHGMGEALYARLLKERPRRRLPHLCAGGRAQGPARLSRAAAAGEWSQFLFRLGFRRSCRTRDAAPAAAAGHHRLSPQGPPSAAAAPGRALRRGSAQFAGRRAWA